MALPPQFFRRSYLLVLTFLVAIYAVVVVVAPTPWVEVPLGLLVLLIAPGYAIGALAFGAKPRWPWSLTFPIVVGLSVAFNVALGLILLEFDLGLPPSAFGFVALLLLMLASLAWIANHPVETGSRFTSYLSDELGLPGLRPAQRAVGYALLLGIVLTLVLIVFIASMFPTPPSQITFGISGPGGPTTTIPSYGNISQNFSLAILIANNATAQQLTLKVLSSDSVTTPTNLTTVAWSPQPVALGPASLTSEPVDLNASQSLTVPFAFSFAHRDTYYLTFDLDDSTGHLLRTAAWEIRIG
jgi:hypothetical protein